MESAPPQIFIRNEQGRIWGPLMPSTIELMIDSGIVKGKVQVSTDGVKFAFPGRFPDFRDFFPKELWGEEGPPVSGTAPSAPSGPPVVTKAGTPAPAPVPVAATVPGSPLPASGELAQVSALHLYYLAASSDQTGLLTLAVADRSFECHFRKGNPEYVASSHAEDSLGEFLRSGGLATADQLAQAEAAKEKFGGELVGALFGMGLLNPGTAVAHLVKRSTDLLHKMLLSESGTFTFALNELPAGRSMPLGNRWAVFAEAVRKLPPAEVKRRLQPYVDRPVMKSGGRVAVTDLKLTPQEARAAALFDGVRALSQFVIDLPAEADHIFRAALLLREVEIVAFSQTVTKPGQAAAASPPPPAQPPAQKPAMQPPAKPPAPPAPKVVITPSAPPKPAAPAATASAPRPASPKPAAPPPAASAPPKPAAPAPTPAQAAAPAAATAATAAPTNDLNELRRLTQQIKEQSHFDVLGLTDKADSAAVKMAYFKLAKLYHPDTVGADAPPELGKLKSEIFGAVGEAYRVLSDDKSRANYIEELKLGKGGAKVDVAQILMSEETFQKGCILVRARKFPEAIKMLDDAINANPDEPEFLAWRGYAKFFIGNDKKVSRAEAEKDILEAIKRNEKVAQAHYFMGQIAKLSGDAAAALRHFKRTVELDPKHLEATREVRMAAPRK